MKLFVSDENKRMEECECAWKEQGFGGMQQIKFYEDIVYQEIIGIGGAATEAAAYNYSLLDEEKKRQFIDLYFGPNGIGYNFVRLHIQSCDFALDNYAYVDNTGDNLLDSFQIDRDQKYIIPFVKDALKVYPDIQFLASPWSPAPFMKDTGEMNNGGELKVEYYKPWAEVVCKYLEAYAKEGIVIKRLTVQNEPAAVQTWDSCIYSATQEAEYAVKALKPALIRHGLGDVKINIWDHNKDILIERVEESFAVEGARDAIDGIAFHWYTGDYFEAVEAIRSLYPDKELIFTEGCVEYSRFATDNQVGHAIMYAHDMIGDFKAGANGFIDWNMLLDAKGGPNHVGNFCDAPIMCTEDAKDFNVNLSYYYIGQLSRFVKPGAKRMLTTSYSNKVETVGFVNVDGSKVIVILNNSDSEVSFNLNSKECGCDISLGAYAIGTVLLV